jgi:tetratricopeptide (TPR) repeat protein
VVEKLSQQRRQNWRYLTGVLGITTLLMVTSGCGMVATGQNMTGVRLYEKGEYYAAMEEFQKAMTSNPDDADAYYNLAATLHRMGGASKDPNALQQAETLYNECLNRNPDHVECYRGLAVLLAHTDRSDRAFVLLKNWATRNPMSADARVELARLYQEYGDTKTAELQLQQAMQLDQTNKRVWAATAALHEQKGDYQQALANYQRAYTLNGYNPALGSRIAALNRATGGSPGAVPPTGTGTRMVDASAPTARY